MTVVRISSDASAVVATVSAFVCFLPDGEGKPQTAMATGVPYLATGQLPEVFQFERDFFEKSPVTQRLYIFALGEAVRLHCWRDLVAEHFSESRILLLVRPEDWVDLYCHGTLLSVVGGTSTVAGRGDVTSVSPEGPQA